MKFKVSFSIQWDNEQADKKAIERSIDLMIKGKEEEIQTCNWLFKDGSKKQFISSKQIINNNATGFEINAIVERIA